MSVDFIFKIAAIGMIVAVLAGVIVVLMMLVPKISALFSGIKSMFDL